ncbi:DMT family transporter [Celerinatantimonas sp. YJH-8]|uniref:DMT family transporter n=1 Tax=Celerinatantimonas sp. YJH-8 TaxID=3228714 RepID=UPI0038BF088A
MKIQQNAILAAGMTSLMWGATGIFVRFLPSLSPFAVTAGRLIVALIFVLPIVCLLANQRKNFKQAIQNPITNLLALLLAGYYLLATAAFQLAPVAEAALLLSTPPLFILMFRRISGDIPSSRDTLGAIIAIIGLFTILAPKISFTDQVSNFRLFGDLLAICAAGLTAVYAYIYQILRKRSKSPETIAVTTLTFLEGSIILIPVILLLPKHSGISTLNIHDITILIGLGIFSTAFPSLGFALASKYLPALITSIISLFIPLFAGIFSFLILGEIPSISFYIGGILVLSGVAIILYHKERKSKNLNFSKDMIRR